ncbi:MAG TPA: hypothetical protein VNB24_02640 [Acidimicrobiales bacterium]|nr:hypothetical protein [Acidimicrobiales bacterium]
MRTVDGLALGQKLGTGGEADVYELTGEPGLAVKLYRADRAGRAEKLRAMAETGPPTEVSSGRLAWPSDLVIGADGSIRGFVMERFDPRRYRPLHQVYNPLTRRAVAPGFDTRYLLRAARNLASTVAAVHAAGAVVGDLNESNVLVDAQGNVALVDCDSFQIVDDEGTVHSCPVGKPEFTPPELHGVELAVGERHPSADVFALAVLVSLLLREGRHPFAGVWTGSGDPPDLAACARRRRLPHRRGALRASPLAVPWRALPRSIHSLSRRSLTAARWRATMRPAAAEWATALHRAESTLRPCGRSQHHMSARRLRQACPWCSLVDAGVPDPFPGESGVGIAAQPTRRAELTRRLGPARSTLEVARRQIDPVVRHIADNTRRRWSGAVRRDAAVAVALAVAAFTAPVATLLVLALVGLPLAALEPDRGWRALRRLPQAVKQMWRRAAITAGIAGGTTVMVVAILWWSPTVDEPFTRWSPAEAGERATRTAAVVAAPAAAIAALRRPRPTS